MGAVSLNNKHRADTIIGVLWAIGMAVGIILIDLTPGYHVDLMSYLFGSILAVPAADLWLMLPLDGFILLAVLLFYKEFVALSYDEEFAFVMGVPVKTLYLLLLGMTAFSIVMIIRVVGLILVIALLTIPPFIAEKYNPFPGPYDAAFLNTEHLFHVFRPLAFIHFRHHIRRHNYSGCRRRILFFPDLGFHQGESEASGTG